MAEPSNGRSRNERAHIAVVAVHGIGEHEPNASAKSIADLLLRLRHDETNGTENRYTSFRRSELAIPVRRAFTQPEREPEEKRTWRNSFRERSEELEAMTDEFTANDRTGGADHLFMRAQLKEYRSSGQPYETVRYEGHRVPAGDPDSPTIDVHVYEMYWADLSRLGSGVLRIFAELFQLIFHIPHLGRQAVEHALLESPRDPWWRRYRDAHTMAVRIFTLVIPLVWLTMAATVLTVVPAAVSPLVAPWIAIAVAAVVGAVICGRFVYRAALAHKPWAWLGVPIGAAAVGLLIFVLLPRIGPTRVLTLEWVVLSTFALVAIARRFEAVRLGARPLGIGLALASGVALTVALSTASERVEIVRHVLNVFEVETILAIVTWTAFYALALISGVLGFCAVRRVSGDARRRARRVAWTARATLAMSAIGALVIGFPVWALIYRAFRWALPEGALHHSLTQAFGARTMPMTDYIERIFEVTGGPGLPWLLLATTVVAVFLSLAVIPSALTELSAPALDGSFRGGDPDEAKEKRQHRNQDEATASRRLGVWLSTGLRIVMWGVNLLFVVMIVAGVMNVWHWMASIGRELDASSTNWFLTFFATWAKQLIVVSGAWLATSAIGLAAFRGRFKSAMLGLHPVLDAALDVDNYLREHPRTGTPRAKIAERYASLLRYLYKWRDVTRQKGYDAIVIVAHSQGTVITADYLGFLQREGDDELPRFVATPQTLDPDHPLETDAPELYLFTMGSPLNQLYSAAFPHLFSWVRGETGPWREALPDYTSGLRIMVNDMTQPRRSRPGTIRAREVIEPLRSPNPTKIGLERWVNAYRSGDYVGRALWRPHDDGDAYEPYVNINNDPGYWDAPAVVVSEDGAGIRRELCIGRGAHTHYWDDTAKLIACELDELLCDAAAPVVTSAASS